MAKNYIAILKVKYHYFDSIQHHIMIDDDGNVTEKGYTNNITKSGIFFNPPRKWDNALLPKYRINFVGEY